MTGKANHYHIFARDRRGVDSFLYLCAAPWRSQRTVDGALLQQESTFSLLVGWLGLIICGPMSSELQAKRFYPTPQRHYY
jgi:hypothetical protein